MPFSLSKLKYTVSWPESGDSPESQRREFPSRIRILLVKCSFAMPSQQLAGYRLPGRFGGVTQSLCQSNSHNRSSLTCSAWLSAKPIFTAPGSCPLGSKRLVAAASVAACRGIAIRDSPPAANESPSNRLNAGASVSSGQEAAQLPSAQHGV